MSVACLCAFLNGACIRAASLPPSTKVNSYWFYVFYNAFYNQTCLRELRERVANGGDPTKLHEQYVAQDIPADEQGIYILSNLLLRSQYALVALYLQVL